MKKYIVILVLLCSFNLSAQNCDCFFKIGFSSKYNKDTVTLSLEGQTIFENITLSHNLSSGYSDLALIFTKKHDFTYIVSNTFSTAQHYIKKQIVNFQADWKGELQLKVVVNGKKFKERININDGCYIIISYNKKKNKIYISQSDRSYQND